MINLINMRRKISLPDLVLSVATLIAAYLLKRHYSNAGVDDLGWILRPTSFAVECLTGIPFVLEKGTGFINSSIMLIIAKSCAGINFLIIAFCMSSFSIFPRVKGWRKKILALWGTAAAVYASTVIINAFRIAVSIYLRSLHFTNGLLGNERLHRIEGSAVYFFFLCIIYLLIQKMMHKGLNSSAAVPQDGRPL